MQPAMLCGASHTRHLPCSREDSQEPFFLPVGEESLPPLVVSRYQTLAPASIFLATVLGKAVSRKIGAGANASVAHRLPRLPMVIAHMTLHGTGAGHC